MTNKALRIGVDLILIILGIIFLVFGIKDLNSMIHANDKTDAELMSSEYMYLSKENVYEYITFKNLTKLLYESGSGMVLIGSPQSPWTQVLVSPLNIIAKEENIKIYYIDINDVDINYDTKDVNKAPVLKDYDVPKVFFVKDGEILGEYKKEDLYDKNYDGIPLEYWTEEKLEMLNETMKNEIAKIK